METIKFNYNDGGRESAGYKGKTGDCVVRAIAIALELPYKEVYNDLTKMQGSSVRDGVDRKVSRKYLASKGWSWIPKMTIGSGCTTHLSAKELPSGRIICSVSRHFSAVIDGVINDTYDCSRNGRRCVYGYFIKK